MRFARARWVVPLEVSSHVRSVFAEIKVFPSKLNTLRKHEASNVKRPFRKNVLRSKVRGESESTKRTTMVDKAGLRNSNSQKVVATRRFRGGSQGRPPKVSLPDYASSPHVCPMPGARPVCLVAQAPLLPLVPPVSRVSGVSSCSGCPPKGRFVLIMKHHIRSLIFVPNWMFIF